MKALHVFIVLMTVLHCTFADEYEELCRLFKSGITIASPLYRHKYIKCNDGTGETLSCDSNKVYEVTKQSCVAATTDEDNACAGQAGPVWVAHPSNCRGYYYCLNSIGYVGYCDVGQHFDFSKQSCIYDTVSTCFKVPNFCSYIPKNTNFVNEASCTSYYICGGSGDPTLKACGSTNKVQNYFERDLDKCEVRTKVNSCKAHPLPKNVCKSGSGWKSDAVTCRGYFICNNLHDVQDLAPTWDQCPEGLFFSEDDQACLPAKEVFCTYNRCNGRGTMFVTSSYGDCHKYIECKDDIEVASYECPLDWFYDESIQACSKKVIYDKCCDGRP